MKEKGARRRLKQSRVAKVSAALVGATAVVLLHDLAAAFDSVRDFVSFDKPWFGVSTAAGLLFGAITLYVTRRHFAADHYPYLSYVRGVREPGVGLTGHGDALWWCVEVSNIGGGLAIVEGTTYDIEIEGAPTSRRENVSFGEMHDVLKAAGLRDERDYSIKHWQPGFGLMPSPDPKRLWEFPLPAAQRIKTLTARMRYSSRVGDEIEITIDAIPPHGLPAG